VQGLRAWLKGSVQGRELLGELTDKAFKEGMEDKCRACENIRPYPKVLVVLRRLGRFPGAEVYAEEGVSIRFVEMPDVPSDGEIGTLVEELIEVSVPRSWRYMIGLPAKRIVRDVFRGMSLVELLRHHERKLALKEIRLLEDIGRPTEPAKPKGSEA
jgi:hypothetical protein